MSRVEACDSSLTSCSAWSRTSSLSVAAWAATTRVARAINCFILWKAVFGVKHYVQWALKSINMWLVAISRKHIWLDKMYSTASFHLQINSEQGTYRDFLQQIFWGKTLSAKDNIIHEVESFLILLVLTQVSSPQALENIPISTPFGNFLLSFPPTKGALIPSFRKLRWIPLTYFLLIIQTRRNFNRVKLYDNLLHDVILFLDWSYVIWI